MQAFTGEPRLEEVADGVHAFLQPDGGWCLNNAGVVVDGGDALLVDTAATTARAARLRELAAKAAARTPRLIVNTHAHGDHTFGNCVFPEAVVVGSERTRAEAVGAGLHLTGLWPDVDWGEIVLRPPQLTFDGDVALHLGDRTALLRTFGPAHSGSDTVLWLPRERVLFAGDLVMSGVTPFVLTGSIRGLRDAIGALRALGAETIVPGHGPVGGPELLDATERYLDRVSDLAELGMAAGLTPLEIAREAELGEFEELIDRERLVPNLFRACAESEEPAAADGVRPAEVDEVFRAMVELHGGLPTCHA
jgi:cyclase